MKVLLQIALCGSFLLGGAMAQHRGGGGMGGGSRGSAGGGGFRGSVGGGGFRGSVGGAVGGGFRGSVGPGVRSSVGSSMAGRVGGISPAFRGGGFGGINRGGVFRGGFDRRFGFGFRGFNSFGYYPWYGYGYGAGYWPGYYDYGYGYPYDYSSPYDYSYQSGYGYPDYQSSPNVTVVYPQNSPPTNVYVDRAQPVMRDYDQYGQEIKPSAGGAPSATGSPTYLLAFKDGVIRQAASYWLTGNVVHYITMQHEEKQAAVDTIDRDQTQELNRQRHVPFIWPSQTPQK